MHNNYDYWSLLGALIISTVSGVISIAQRIVLGQRATLIWVTSEFLAAILCGYLMYDIYPKIAEDLPKWATLPVLVALAAHVGGRSFQMFERALYRRYKFIEKRLPPIDELD
jgi:hypothetical protein